MVLQHKEQCIRHRSKRCVEFLKCDKHFKNETVPNRRYEWSVSGMNEQIFDLTGGKSLILLDFTSGSSRATSFQKCKNALFPFRSAFTLAGYRLRLSPYVKSAILKIPSGSLILNFAFETLKRFQPLRQSFALAHFVRFHLTSVLRNFRYLFILPLNLSGFFYFLNQMCFNIYFKQPIEL